MLKETKITDNNTGLLHFTAGTPARLVLQVTGLTMLTLSINSFVTGETVIGFIKGISLFIGGVTIFLLREHVSNGDYIKEFSKYAADNLVFTQPEPEPESEEDDPEGYQ